MRPPRARVSTSTARGFTLIELMIVVAIVAILAAIALPSYRDYILRGQLVDATSLLSAGRANMERYYQDNRTFASVSASIVPPCDTGIAAAKRTQGKFLMTCSGTPNATSYTLQAVGTGAVSTFTYTVNQDGTQSTTIAAGGPWPAGTTACWVTKKGQTC